MLRIIHITVLILSALLFVLFASIGRHYYSPHAQHLPTSVNATHVDVLYGAHGKQFTALKEELTTLVEDVQQFDTITGSLLLTPEIIQKFHTAGRHIEQLQNAAACEGTGPWKAEAFVLALTQPREFSLCEWLGGWEATIDIAMTYDELRTCWLETGDAVMTADGKGIKRAQATNDGHDGNKARPVGDEQALLHIDLDCCMEVLELRDEFIRDSGDLGEGKFLRSAIGKWRVR